MMKFKELFAGIFLFGLTFVSQTAAAQSEQFCREFTRNIVVDGKTVKAFGTACRDESGDWKIVSSKSDKLAKEAIRDEDTIIIAKKPKAKKVIVLGHNGYYDDPYYRNRSFHYGSSYDRSYGYKKYAYTHGGFHHKGFNRGHYRHRNYHAGHHGKFKKY